MSKAYFIGIAGKATAEIAKALRDDLGWEVSGSDEPFGPPATDYLAANHLAFKTPYQAENVPADADLVVVGGGALTSNPNNPEYLRARDLGLRIVSYPQLLEKYLIKKNSIVVVGTYGKTTITALLAWILQKAGFDPSFMIGGFPKNFADGVKFSNSDYSVVEGDEHPTLNFDPRPKFAFYHPTQLLLTSALWDHYNVYKTEPEYVKIFQELVTNLPASGRLIASVDGENISQVLPLAKCQVVTYSVKTKADWTVSGLHFGEKTTTFAVNGPGGEKIELETSQIGLASVINILGAVAMARSLGVEPLKIQEAVRSFEGVKERLEIVGESGGVTLVRDFAHSPIKIKTAIEALRTRFLKDTSKILVVLDLHSTVLRDKTSLPALKESLVEADAVALLKIKSSPNIPEEKRVLAKDLLHYLPQPGLTVRYCPNVEQLKDFAKSFLKSHDVIIFMSSGEVSREIEAVRNAILV
ncbi:MAG: Mur ligase family protein [bacterium]|nr:Mur ligase family protein [bacterium]